MNYPVVNQSDKIRHSLKFDKMHDKINSFAGSNPPKFIELSSGLPMHFKMNLEIYQTQKIMNLIVTKFN